MLSAVNYSESGVSTTITAGKLLMKNEKNSVERWVKMLDFDWYKNNSCLTSHNFPIDLQKCGSNKWIFKQFYRYDFGNFIF